MYSMSVIIPVYRVEKYLRKCLNSVVAQTLTNIEVIIVDDGSDDNSGIIADEYARKYTHISCIHKTNGGLASARSAGMEVASGEYIAFLDSDDWVDDNTYEILYRIAVENNKPDIIMYRSYDEVDSLYIPPQGYYDRQRIENEILPYIMPYFDSIGKPHYLRFSNCMKIYKHSFLKEAGIFYHDGILIKEDVIFSIECTDRAKTFYYIDKELYHVTVNPNSLSRSHYNKNNTESVLRISEYLRNYHERCNGYQYGNAVFSGILFFLESGIGNELNASNFIKCFLGIHRILNSDICKWYIHQHYPFTFGWYGKVQLIIHKRSTVKLLFDLKYKSILKKKARKIKNVVKK